MPTFDEILNLAQSLSLVERVEMARALCKTDSALPLIVTEVRRRSTSSNLIVITFNVTNTVEKPYTITAVQYETLGTFGQRHHFGTLHPLESQTIYIELEDREMRLLFRGFETPDDLPESEIIGNWTSNHG